MRFCGPLGLQKWQVWPHLPCLPLVYSRIASMDLTELVCLFFVDFCYNL